MNKKILTFISLGFFTLVLGLGFQNCADQQLPVLTLAGEASSSSLAEDAAIDAAPTDAKQTLESMMSLLDLTAKDISISEVNSEINYRRNLLVPQNDIQLLNSPAIIATTSLAGVVCKQAVNKEKKASSKNIFPTLDFGKGPKSYGKSAAVDAYVSLAERFWARKPTAEETQFFTQAVEEYFSTLSATAMETASESDKLAIFICTGMLAVPDSYLL